VDVRTIVIIAQQVNVYIVKNPGPYIRVHVMLNAHMDTITTGAFAQNATTVVVGATMLTNVLTVQVDTIGTMINNIVYNNAHRDTMYPRAQINVNLRQITILVQAVAAGRRINLH